MIYRNKSLSIAVFSAAAAQHDKALHLARKLAIPLVQHQHEIGSYEFLLSYTPSGLVLQQTRKDNLGAVMADFTSPAMLYRIRHGGGRRQALARAVGLKKGWQPSVIDATAGLGRDGFILACLNCHVLLLERSAVLAAMVSDALERAAQSKETAAIVKERLRLIFADSKDYLQRLRPEDYPDVIYIDPMYPERSKSSLVKKEMRILRAVAGPDPDAAKLLAVGLNRARSRVVVKRPRLAAILGNLQPSHQLIGKTSRFDIYLTP